MFEIIMNSGNGTTRDFMGGFSTFEEAEQVCDSYGWVFSEDAGGFEWDLEIIEVYEENCDILEPEAYELIDYKSDFDDDEDIFDDF